MILATWCISNNFGDKLTWWMIKQITGEAPAWVTYDDPRPHYMGAGSILNLASPSTVVWGSGLASGSDIVNKDARILALRGPLSGSVARAAGAIVPEVYGDPAMLLPRLMPHHGCPTDDLGIICHYIDRADAPKIAGARYIDVFADIEDIATDICCCRHIISSSLHGLIAADAYGIPTAWAKGTPLPGDDTKFYDHMEAVHAVADPMDLRSLDGWKASRVIDAMPRRTPKYDATPLADSCPFGTI